MRARVTSPMKPKKNKDGLKWMRCRDCQHVKYCFWPVREVENGRKVAVCPKCWDRNSR